MPAADSHPFRRLLVALIDNDPRQRNTRKLASDANKFGQDFVGFKKLNKALLNNWIRPTDNSTPRNWQQLAALLKVFDVDENLADIMFRVTTRGWDLEALQEQAAPELAGLLKFRQPILSFRQPTLNPAQTKPSEIVPVATGDSTNLSDSVELVHFDTNIEPFHIPSVDTILEYIQTEYQTRPALLNKPLTPKRNRRVVPVVAAVVLIAVATVAWFQTRPDSERGATLTEDVPAPDLAGLIAQADTGSGPWLAAAHEDYRFRIAGVVPDEETKAAIGDVVGVFYSRFQVQDIEVDPTVGTALWVEKPEAGVVPLLRVLAFKFHQGGFSLNTTQLKVEGQVPDLVADGVAFKDASRITASKYPALPNYEENIEVVELDKFPELRATYDGESLVISGRLPSQTLTDAIMEDLKVLFDEIAVVDDVVIEDRMFAAFPVRNIQRSIKAFYFSEEFDVQLQQGQITGSITSGIEFAEGSAELSQAVKASLRSLAAFAQLAHFPIEVVGHTDAQEPAGGNNELSLKRAEAIRQYLIATGTLTPERAEKIATVGKSSQEPIANNDTEDGRRKNRRVEIHIKNGGTI